MTDRGPVSFDVENPQYPTDTNLAVVPERPHPNNNLVFKSCAAPLFNGPMVNNPPIVSPYVYQAMTLIREFGHVYNNYAGGAFLNGDGTSLSRQFYNMGTLRALVSLLVVQSACGAVLTVCQALADRARLSGSTVAVRGIIVRSDHGTSLQPDRCVSNKVDPWPAVIWLRWNPSAGHGNGLPPQKADEDLTATVSGVFRSVPPGSSPRSSATFGFGHLSEAPAEIGDALAAEAVLVKPAYISVCELLTRRRDYHSARVSVRGELIGTASGSFLRAHDCAVKVEHAEREWPLAVWLKGVGASMNARYNAPWVEPGTAARITTIHGVFTTVTDPDGKLFGERLQYLGEIEPNRMSHDELVPRTELRLRRRR